MHLLVFRLYCFFHVVCRVLISFAGWTSLFSLFLPSTSSFALDNSCASSFFFPPSPERRLMIVTATLLPLSSCPVKVTQLPVAHGIVDYNDCPTCFFLTRGKVPLLFSPALAKVHCTMICASPPHVRSRPLLLPLPPVFFRPFFLFPSNSHFTSIPSLAHRFLPRGNCVVPSHPLCLCWASALGQMTFFPSSFLL